MKAFMIKDHRVFEKTSWPFTLNDNYTFLCISIHHLYFFFIFTFVLNSYSPSYSIHTHLRTNHRLYRKDIDPLQIVRGVIFINISVFCPINAEFKQILHQR